MSGNETPPNISFLRFDEIIGRGGMTVVWRVWHKEYNCRMAVKVLNEGFAETGQDVRQFMMEVRAMTNICHPGIVKGYGADCADGRYYFLMEYVNGYSFANLLSRKTKLSQTDALIICESVASAMKHAWNSFGIIHCDIKPDNIMVNEDGVIKIMDLGLCRSKDDPRQDGKDDEILGTPAYISPEQIYADVKLDCRADVYCLGAALYHLVTGHILFPCRSNDAMLRNHVDPEQQAPDPRQFNPDLSESFVRLLFGMLVKDRNHRYQSWDDVLAAAQIIDSGGKLPPPPKGIVSSISIDSL